MASTQQPKRYIVWSTNKKIDLKDSFQRKWFIKQVLAYGRAEDIAQLNWDEIRELLLELDLREDIKALWENYFYGEK